MTLGVDADGALYSQSQVEDYVGRGADLEQFNAMDFFVETYEEEIVKQNTPCNKPKGCRPQPRIPYLASHPRHKQKVRVIQGNDHRTLPNFVGHWFPQRNSSLPQHAYYCASMLMLLKPWRTLQDLKRLAVSWPDAFNEFHTSSCGRIKRLMSGADYFHQCRNAAQDRSFGTVAEVTGPEEQTNTTRAVVQCHEQIEQELPMSQQEIEEDWHGRLAVEIARGVGIFPITTSIWPIFSHGGVFVARPEDYMKLVLWRKHLEVETAQLNNIENMPLDLSSTHPCNRNHRRDVGTSVTAISDNDTAVQVPGFLNTTDAMQPHAAGVLSNEFDSTTINDEQL